MERFMTGLAPLVLLVLFSGLLAMWITLAYRPDRRLEEHLVRGGQVVGILYILWLLGLGLWQGRAPVITPGQLMASLGGLAWVGHAYTQRRVRQRMLTLLPLGTVVVLLVAALATGLKPPAAPPEALANSRAAAHIVFSLAAVALLMGTGVFGAGQLIMHRQLKRRTFGTWFHHLPSLDDLDRLRRISLNAGWVLVTISVIGGMAALYLVPERQEATISHLHPMLLLWGVMTLLWAANRFRWLGGSRLAVASVVFAGMMAVLLVVSVIEFFGGRLM